MMIINFEPPYDFYPKWWGSTDAPYPKRCGTCGKPDHGTAACESVSDVEILPPDDVICWWMYPVLYAGGNCLEK
jgi:hypothetical protein